MTERAQLAADLEKALEKALTEVFDYMETKDDYLTVQEVADQLYDLGYRQVKV